jgi:hypothetical protein
VAGLMCGSIPLASGHRHPEREIADENRANQDLLKDIWGQMQLL